MTGLDERSGNGMTVVVAGSSGDLGARIASALARRGADVRALVRRSSSAIPADAAEGLAAVAVDYDDEASLVDACRGAACVVSALNGLEPVILGAQGRLFDAAGRAGVPRFIPSDFSLDFTRTRPGDNRNLDLRRAFMDRVERSPMRVTSVLNGGFAELLAGGAPIVLRGPRRILYWGDPDQPLDFTTKDDVARFTAEVALDEAAPRFLRIAGDVVSPRSLAELMTDVTGRTYGLWRAGDLDRLGRLIRIARALTPGKQSVFPAWQGMQYLRDMASGRGKLHPLDNGRYGHWRWTLARDVLSARA